MWNHAAKIGVALNLAILLALIDVGWRLAQPVYPSSLATPPYRSGAQDRSTYQPGESISIPGIDFRQADRTLVLVLRKSCHFCEASMPFYRVLADGQKQLDGTHLVVASSDDVHTTQSNL